MIKLTRNIMRTQNDGVSNYGDIVYQNNNFTINVDFELPNNDLEEKIKKVQGVINADVLRYSVYVYIAPWVRDLFDIASDVRQIVEQARSGLYKIPWL